MKILVTGGAGFLGRGILRRIAQGSLDWEVTVYSRDETKQVECTKRYPEARYILGDVRDVDRLAVAMSGHDAVVHAAAVKYIPEAELNADECVKVNVHGSENVITAARRAGVGKVVGISTDKAVQPVNIYGASKMVMERLFADTVRFSDLPKFVCVRYGNVIGSTGSVIPMFHAQWAMGGPITITNPDMTRFWMSVDEAIDLIVWALKYSLAGSVVVPPARAMKIIDVAEAVVKANFRDGDFDRNSDMAVKIIGERPGEKLHETLIHYEESVRVLKNRDPFLHELRPPSERTVELPFTLASHTPNHWMTIEEMATAINDSQEV